MIFAISGRLRCKRVPIAQKKTSRKPALPALDILGRDHPFLPNRYECNDIHEI